MTRIYRITHSGVAVGKGNSLIGKILVEDWKQVLSIFIVRHSEYAELAAD